ncbi:DUF1007 family protein [Paracoccus ravus]|uniref:DUF1007 family protein n=1 Tax=Paracoccus ravus TaxID=2447760 RepID=UPI00106E2967|nr:DUF1007 family protein [Paracoccus ravus]
MLRPERYADDWTAREPRPAGRARGAVAALLAALSGACLAAAPAAAHPHVFIEADAALIFDQSGRLEAIRVTWTYDEFYSLMMIEDGQLDSNGDGTPEAERLAAFAGQDVDWAAGFPGHILVEQGATLPLDPPLEHEAAYAKGRIVTSHLRPLTEPLAVTAAQPLRLRLYDPEYFVAYDTPRAPSIEGRSDCKVTRHAPDSSGQGELLAALQDLDMTADSISVMEMPDVGITFAEGFEVTCGAR